MRLRFSAADVATLRVATSPLWECVASLRVLKEPRSHPLHRRWVPVARARLNRSAIDCSLLNALVPVPTTVLPSFLAPTPQGPAPSLEAELRALTSVDPQLCTQDLEQMFPDAMPPIVRAFARDPAAGLRRLARQTTDYFRTVVEPDWPRARAVLDGDVLYRGLRLVHGGATLLFRDLAASVSWDGDTLTVDHPTVGTEHELAGRGLVLVPSAFTSPRVFVKVSAPWAAVVRYPARGVATLWTERAVIPHQLAGVLGKSRALILSELEQPASTTELARRTGLAVSGVSAHLRQLRNGGLVTGYRAGAVVLYVRTELGQTLFTGSVASRAVTADS